MFANFASVALTMKKLTILFAFLFASVGLFAQNDVKDQVVSALGSGNAAALGKHLVANVELTVLNVSEYYSKAQAEQILKKFFDEHDAQGMSVEHEGTSKMGDRYYIGRLKTANGEFRVTFFLKKATDVFQVKQLRIESGKSER
jgi:uncharacterized membrane protein YcgQ (UPF0703/DUF1980 family)